MGLRRPRGDRAREKGDTVTWDHDALAADLMDCRHLAGEVAVERLRIGPGYTREGIQLDVAGMRLSWTEPRMTGYEVKVSRADFLADLHAEKWRKYMGSCERLYFACPRGLIDAREVPPECGVLYRHDTTWRAARIAPPLPITDAARCLFLQSLLGRHYPTDWDGPQRLRRRLEPFLTPAAFEAAP